MEFQQIGIFKGFSLCDHYTKLEGEGSNPQNSQLAFGNCLYTERVNTKTVPCP